MEYESLSVLSSLAVPVWMGHCVWIRPVVGVAEESVKITSASCQMVGYNNNGQRSNGILWWASALPDRLMPISWLQVWWH